MTARCEMVQRRLKMEKMWQRGVSRNLYLDAKRAIEGEHCIERQRNLCG